MSVFKGGGWPGGLSPGQISSRGENKNNITDIQGPPACLFTFAKSSHNFEAVKYACRCAAAEVPTRGGGAASSSPLTPLQIPVDSSPG